MVAQVEREVYLLPPPFESTEDEYWIYANTDFGENYGNLDFYARFRSFAQFEELKSGDRDGVLQRFWTPLGALLDNNNNPNFQITGMEGNVQAPYTDELNLIVDFFHISSDNDMPVLFRGRLSADVEFDLWILANNS